MGGRQGSGTEVGHERKHEEVHQNMIRRFCSVLDRNIKQVDSSIRQNPGKKKELEM